MVRFNIFRFSRARLLTILTTSGVFALAIWFLNEVLPYKNFWFRFSSEDHIGTFFCEYTNMANIVRQPINTFSNFVYWMAGIAILNRGLNDRTKLKRYNIISANPFYSILFGSILLYTFFASVFFHSSLINFASNLDFSAVYSLSLFPLMYFIHRLWLLRLGVPSNTKHYKSTATLIVVFTIAYLFMTFTLTGAFREYVVLGMIVVLIISGIVVEKQDPGKTNHWYLLICILYILFAVMWFIFDVKKVVCNPDSIVQPHSLWHIFSGTAAFYFYMYIRSEKNKI